LTALSEADERLQPAAPESRGKSQVTGRYAGCYIQATGSGEFSDHTLASGKDLHIRIKTLCRMLDTYDHIILTQISSVCFRPEAAIQIRFQSDS
jgi:hypothetical protein